MSLKKLANKFLGITTVLATSSCTQNTEATYESSQLTPQKARKSNVLFLFADDMTYSALNSVWGTQVKTPNLDKLAKRGVVFTHAYNQGSWSGAICVCSRAMINSGLNLNSAKHKLAQVPHWGETFRDNGYSTFLTGKWHNNAWSVHKSFTHAGPVGPGMPPSNSKQAYHRPAKGNTWTPHETKWGGHWTPRVAKYNPDVENPNKCLTYYRANKHTSELYADAAIDYLSATATNSSQPFFMYVAFNAPHDPRQAPKRFVDMYPLDQIELPPNYMPLHPFDQGENRIRDEILAPFPRTPHVTRTHIQEYYAIISHMDEQIGRILDALEITGKADNTYIVFTADHGLAVGSHGLMGKQNQYEHSTRAPLIFVGPNIKQGVQTDAMCYLHSIFPTTCDLAGIPKPTTIESKSLYPILSGQPKKGEEIIFGSYKNMQKMVRNKEFKLIEYDVAGVHTTQLFKISEDSHELHNLSQDTQYAPIIKELQGHYKTAEEQNIFMPRPTLFWNWSLSPAYPYDRNKPMAEQVYPPEKGNFPKNAKRVRSTIKGNLDLLTNVSRKQNIFAYGQTNLVSPKALTTKLGFNSDDGITVWLNGKKIHEKDILRGITHPTEYVDVKLQKGDNRILVKVSQAGGGWGVRITVDPKLKLVSKYR